MRPRGFVRDRDSNAVWDMQFIWPIRSEYLVAHVDPGYTETIIARSRLDYVWIMARTPQIPEQDFERLARKVADLGYDVARLQKVPQRW
jgi:apolipoprotein D and lipocalin family protein